MSTASQLASEFLFVYGTLIPQKPNRRQVGDVVSVSPASIEANLYDLGWFPGAVQGKGKVKGVILEYSREEFEKTLPYFDRYEGYDVALDDGLYIRRQVTATRPDGSAVTVWVYFFNDSPTGRPHITSGDWLAYKAQRDA